MPHGSFTAILGASGSGKTTLLRIVAGFERPDEGQITLGEEIVDDARHRFVPSEHRRIGYVPQEGALFPHLNVGRNIAFGLAPGPGARRPGSTSCSSSSGCPAWAGATRTSSPAGSSSGSPWPGPWPSNPRSCCSTSRSPRSMPRCAPRCGPTCCDVLRQAGTTSILVTHDQDEALSMADQVAVLRHGVHRPARHAGAAVRTPVGRGAGACSSASPTCSKARSATGSVTTALGRLALRSGWSGPAGGGAATGHGPPRADRRWASRATGVLEGTVASYEYFGHDAVVRVRPGSADLPELVVRVTGGHAARAGAPGRALGAGAGAWPGPPDGSATAEQLPNNASRNYSGVVRRALE